MDVAIQSPLRPEADGTPIALTGDLMFVNEFLFSFLLLAFTALLCLFGVALLLDGITRFLREGYKELRRTKSATAKSGEERVTTAERAA